MNREESLECLDNLLASFEKGEPYEKGPCHEIYYVDILSYLVKHTSGKHKAISSEIKEPGKLRPAKRLTIMMGDLMKKSRKLIKSEKGSGDNLYSLTEKGEKFANYLGFRK